MVLRPSDLLHSINVLSESFLEVVDADVRLLLVIVHNQEALITTCELNVLGLYATTDRDLGPDELHTIECAVYAEAEGDSRRKHIAGVLSHVHRLDCLLDIEDTDSSAVVCVIHADVSIVRASEEEVSVLVVHDLADGSRVACQIDGLHFLY